MKPIIYLMCMVIMASMVLGVNNPYPVYGKTNPLTEVKAVSGTNEKATISDSEGNYILELNSDYTQINIQTMGCSVILNLPKAPAYKYDFPCTTPKPTPIPIATIIGGIGGLIATFGIGYVLLKYNTASKLRKLTKDEQIKILKELGVSDQNIPKTEGARVALIMELRKKLP